MEGQSSCPAPFHSVELERCFTTLWSHNFLVLYTITCCPVALLNWHVLSQAHPKTTKSGHQDLDLLGWLSLCQKGPKRSVVFQGATWNLSRSCFITSIAQCCGCCPLWHSSFPHYGATELIMCSSLSAQTLGGGSIANRSCCTM